ncbi:hypothetical protein PI124_g20020 [Phytophthora idaei]|nr:hypothetical protein PI124_g20020 [Phytophthora idaei]
MPKEATLRLRASNQAMAMAAIETTTDVADVVEAMGVAGGLLGGLPPAKARSYCTICLSIANGTGAPVPICAILSKKNARNHIQPQDQPVVLSGHHNLVDM